MTSTVDNDSYLSEPFSGGDELEERKSVESALDHGSGLSANAVSSTDGERSLTEGKPSTCPPQVLSNIDCVDSETGMSYTPSVTALVGSVASAEGDGSPTDVFDTAL